MRKECIVCGAELFEEPLILLNNMPASAQDIPEEKELGNDKGIRLRLCQCSVCGLVQLDCEPVWYYRDVIRAGGFTTTMMNLRKKQYEVFIKKYHLEQKKILEVGTGQGEFLRILSDFNVRAYGIEHKLELVEQARKKGLNVTNEFAENAETKLKNAPFDAFLSFNFLEHQPNPNGMLRAIYHNLTEQGVGLLTVPSWEYITQCDGFYELIRDHLAYYTFDTLGFLLQKNGFEVEEQEMVNRDTLSVMVRKRKFSPNSQLQKSFDMLNKEIDEYLKQLESEGKKLCLWGAGHQGFTIAACTGLRNFAEYIIDSAPFKQGRYAPASHIAIVPPEHFEKEPVDVILIVAPGYTKEITDVIKNRFPKWVEIVMLKSDHLEFVQEQIEENIK